MTVDADNAALLERAESVGASLPHPEGNRVDRDLIAGLAESGLLRLLYPEGGVSARDLCLIRQGLARSNTAAETAFAMQGLGSHPIHQTAIADVGAQWMAGVVNGSVVPAFALTEPDAGSDAASLALAATEDGDSWVLTGEKAWISNAPDADVYVVFARTTADAGARGVTAFLVPADTPGVTGRPVDMLTPHPIGHLTLDGVRIPSDHLMGERDKGFAVAMATLDLFRPSVGAFAIGMAETALSIASSHAEERHAFGQPIFDFQAVSHSLAEMATAVVSARLLVYEAAAAYDSGDTHRLTGLAAMAKLTATETAQRVVDGAIQIMGARGLQADHPLARLYRDVRAPRIYEGTSEIQRGIIARELRRGRLTW